MIIIRILLLFVRGSIFCFFSFLPCGRKAGKKTGREARKENVTFVFASVCTDHPQGVQVVGSFAPSRQAYSPNGKLPPLCRS